MTFICKLDPYSLKIYWTYIYELPTSRLSKIIIWQRDTVQAQSRMNQSPNCSNWPSIFRRPFWGGGWSESAYYRQTDTTEIICHVASRVVNKKWHVLFRKTPANVSWTLGYTNGSVSLTQLFVLGTHFYLFSPVIVFANFCTLGDQLRWVFALLVTRHCAFHWLLLFSLLFCTVG